MKSKLQANRTDIILFSLAVAFTVIGVHQVMVNGIAASYWIFMLVFSFLIIYNIRKMGKKKEDHMVEDSAPQLPREERRRQERKQKNRKKL